MNTQKNNSAISALQVLLAALLWGTLGVFVTFLRQAGFSTLQIVFLRAAVSVLLLGIFIFLRDRSKFRIQLRDSWIFIGTGLISFTLFTVCNQIAMRLCSLSIAAALLYTSPAFILIFSAVIFRERLTAAKLISIAVTVFGCFLVSGLLTPGAVISGAGILAGIASGLCYGLYSIFGRFGVEKYDSLTVTFYTFLLAAAASLPFADFASMPAVFSSADWVLPLVCAFGPVTCLLPYLFLYRRSCGTGTEYCRHPRHAGTGCQRTALRPYLPRGYELAEGARHGLHPRLGGHRQSPPGEKENKIKFSAQTIPQSECLRCFYTVSYLNSSAASVIRSAIFTPNGQRSSHA